MMICVFILIKRHVNNKTLAAFYFFMFIMMQIVEFCDKISI